MRTYMILILLLCSIPSISQNCENTLFGTITDLHDGSLLFGATIIVAGTEQALQSDIDGKFVISNLCDNTYTIQVSHPSCLTKGFTFKISGDLEKTFKLEHHLEELNEVTLKGSAFQISSKSILENKISQEDLERFSGGTLGDALNSLSGVSSLNTGNAIVKPIIHGLHSSRIVMINNGVRMEDQQWGAEHAPNIDVNAINNVTLIKGAGGLQFGGDAVGGVILAEPSRIPIKDTLYGKTLITAVSNGRGASTTTKLVKSYQSGWYGSLHGSVKRFGDFESPDYILSNTGTYERSASLNFGFNRFDFGIDGYYSIVKNDIGILRASHLGGARDQIRAINSDRPLIINDFTYKIDAPKQSVTHHLARVKGFKKFDFGKMTLQYDFQRNDRKEFDVRRGDDRDKASLDLQLQTHTLLLDLDSRLTDEIKLKSGLMARYQTNFANPDTGVRRLIPDYDKNDIGVYLVADYKFNDKLLLEAGGRFDYSFIDAFKFYRTSFWEDRNYDQIFPEIIIEEFNNQILTNPELNYYNASTTIGATYSLNETYKLYFNYSLASRAPNPSELFSEGLHHSASRIELGDLRFVSEIANKISLTFQRDTEKFNYSLSPFVDSISNFIVIEPTSIQQTVRGNFQVWEYRQTNAMLLGFDFDATYLISENFHFKHQFSFVKGYDREMSTPLINMPPVNTKNEFIYQNPKFKNIRLTIQSEYVFQQNEYPNTNFEVFIPETNTNELVDVSTPPDAYHLLNFSSSIDLNFTKNSTLTTGISVSNVLNTSYRNYLNRQRYYADELGRNFLLNLKINY